VFVAAKAKASSRLGYQVENLPSSRVCRTFFSIGSIEFTDWLVIARLGVPVGGQNRDGQRRNSQEEFSIQWGCLW